jgi:hypothetical protein
MSDDEQIEELRKAAAFVIETMGSKLDIELGYDDAGVRFLDGYIQRQHEQGDEAIRRNLVVPLGAFLGECLIRNANGQWKQDKHGWAVWFSNGNAAYPLTKVEKHLTNGAEAGDSVYGFYSLAVALFNRPGPLPEAVVVRGLTAGGSSSPSSSGKSKKPWWKFW